MRQVLMNFISNSIKFTHTGYVLVEVECSEPIDNNCTVRRTPQLPGVMVELDLGYRSSNKSSI